MRITDVRIGDRVCDKRGKFPMTVVGMFSSLEDMRKGQGTLYLDFDGNEGDVWEEDVKDVELINE